jgi:hypothetical protein
MGQYLHRLLNRNLLFAFGVLVPFLYAINGHVWLGIVFIACVVAGRFSAGPLKTRAHPIDSTKP